MEAVAAPSGVALALLGGWSLSVTGQPVATPAYDKGRALLAYLAVENRWHSREALGALFWPDSGNYRANLRQVLANLRAVLKEREAAAPFLLVRRDAIAINPACASRLDITVFLAEPPCCDGIGTVPRCTPCLQRMEKAGSLYHGDFLAGLSLPDCPDFEEWAGRWRETLRRRAVTLYGRLADCHEHFGTAESALIYAHRAAEFDPWDEAARRRLMRLLTTSGQSAAALRQYELLEALLTREIGIQPEEATRELCRQIRAGCEAADAKPPDEVRRVVVLQVETEIADETDALEPERHLVPLDAAIDQALSRWHGRRIPSTGLSLGAVFGLVDDAEQAPRRALCVAQAIAARPQFTRVRIGICEGRALIGRDARQSIADGMLPALAQRLALCGESGDIIVSAALAREMESHAGVEPLPQRRFPGLPGEHIPCRIKIVSNREYVPYPAAFATPFVGRRAERARFMLALAAASKGCRPVFVEVTGPPGVGKSRLLAELAYEHHAAGGEVRWIAHRPELRHVSLGALRDAHGGWASLAPNDADELSGRLLINAMVERLFSVTDTRQPALLVFDDLHWADAATRELLELAMQSPPNAPVLAVLAGRVVDGIRTTGAVVSRIALSPLKPDESLSLIAAIDREDRISPLERARLARSSGGLPLYAEYVARTASSQTPAPDISLFGLLQSVLDRMGPDKQVLQAASVFGVSFERSHIHALLPGVNIESTLQHAVDVAIIRRVEQSAFVFHHALLRDCVYESIPPLALRLWHNQAGEWLGSLNAAPLPDIAQHFETAQAWPAARKAWQQAAAAAYRQEFAGDARESVMRALACAAREKTVTVPEMAELELLAGYATLMTHGYGAEDAQRFFKPLVVQPGADVMEEARFRALTGMVAACPQGSVESFAMMERLREMAHCPAHDMMVDYGMGSLLFWRGQFAVSLERIEKVIGIRNGIRPHEWLQYSADHPGVACHALKAINLAFSGTAESAETAAAEAVMAARKENRTHGLCFALTIAAGVHMVLDNPGKAGEMATEGLNLAERRHFQLWQAYNTMLSLWAKARTGQLALSSALRLVSMRRALAAASRLSPVTAWWFVACIFEAIGQWKLLDASAARALALAEKGGDTYCMADLMRQRGLARLRAGDTPGARRWLGKAYALMEAQGSWGLMPRIQEFGGQVDS